MAIEVKNGKAYKVRVDIEVSPVELSRKRDRIAKKIAARENHIADLLGSIAILEGERVKIDEVLNELGI